MAAPAIPPSPYGIDQTARATLNASVRVSDGQYPVFDADLKNGIYYTGKIGIVLDSALADVAGVYTRASSALHMSADKVLAASAQNAPTVTYLFSPSVTARGAVFERASYQQIASSSALWGTLSNATQITSPAAGPDGALSMYRATSTTAGGYVQQGSIPLPGDTSRWVGSVMVAKTAASATVSFAVVGTGGTGSVTTVSLDTLSGVATSPNGAPVEFGAIDQGNFWLLWVSLSLTNNTAAQVRFYPGGTAGTGTADYGFGQIEPGYTPSSRIKTTGTPGVRRERDTLTIPVAALTAAGTIEITAAPPTGALSRILAQVDDGTESNRVTVQRAASGNIQVVWVSGGNVVSTMDLGAHVARTSVKVVIGWSGTVIKAIRDGVLVTANLAAPVGLKTLRIGGNTTTTSLDGPVSRLTYWQGLRTDPFYEEPIADFMTAGDSMAAAAGTSGDDRWYVVLSKNLGRAWNTIAVGGTTSTQMRDAYLATTTNLNRLLLIFTGHNSPNANQTVADIQAALAHQSPDPRKRRFLIGVTTQSLQNAPGSAGYIEIAATQAAIKSIWPDNYVDIPAALLAAAVALGDTAASDPNIQNGQTPTRYLADAIHINAAGQLVEEAAWRTKMLAKGW